MKEIEMRKKSERAEQKYIYFLTRVPGLGSRGIEQLLGIPGGAEAVYRMKEETFMALGVKVKEAVKKSLLSFRQNYDLEGEYQKLQKAGIQMTWRGEASYPKRLECIPDPPAVLFYRGQLPPEDKVHVAVVGARECSEYGSYMARELGDRLARADMVLVSGMARGIDGIGQLAAGRKGGFSVGVLGCGVDICYPKQNRELYEMLVDRGCVLSEYVPGTQPVSNFFPARNRIISGMADALVVIEAREKSGTFITVDMALEQGRDVYVIPGRLTDPLSTGCNRLIHQGAEVLVSVEEFVDHLQEKARSTVRTCSCKIPERKELPKRKQNEEKEGPGSQIPSFLSEQEKMVYQALDTNPIYLEKVFQKLQQPMELQELMWILLQLCIKGVAKQVGTNSYVKVVM